MDARGKLAGMEALRGIAACAVVLYHVARHLDQAWGAPLLMRLFQPGHVGVDLFFVLSGFIILHVHRADIGKPERLRRYARQRFIRLMPIYWIALGLTALSLIAGGNDAPSAGRLLWSASLMPTRGEPLLGVAWTLQHELLFYLLFAVLILSRRLGVALLLLWLAWIAAGLAGWGGDGAVPRLSSPYNVEFLLGMGAAWALAGGHVAAPRAVAAVGGAMLLASCVAESLGLIDGYGSLARISNGVPSALLISGLAAWEQRGGLRPPAWARALGEASYSIYLFQFLCIAVAWQVWVRAGLDGKAMLLPAFLALAGAGLTGGVIMHRLVERPVLRWVRGRAAGPKPLFA
jgi:exopolysaccharide production protein ExoZ